MLLVMREIGVQALPHIERWPTSGGSLTINRGNGTVSIVKDRVSSDIGARKPLQNWTSIKWGQVKKRVRNLHSWLIYIAPLSVPQYAHCVGFASGRIAFYVLKIT